MIGVRNFNTPPFSQIFKKTQMIEFIILIHYSIKIA